MENGKLNKKEKYKIFSKTASYLFIIGVLFFVAYFIFHFFVYSYDRVFYCYLMPDFLEIILVVITFASPVLLLLAFLSEFIGLIMGGFKKRKIKIIILFLSFVLISALILISLFFAGAGRCSRSRTASLRATASSLRPMISMCCHKPEGVLLTTPGEDICNPSIGFNLPSAYDFDQRGAIIDYNIKAQCDNEIPALHIHFSGKLPFPECTDITISDTKVLFNPGCY